MHMYITSAILYAMTFSDQFLDFNEMSFWKCPLQLSKLKWSECREKKNSRFTSTTSQMLTKSEKKYSIVETLVVGWEINYFHTHLFGRDFLVTDHKLLRQFQGF